MATIGVIIFRSGLQVTEECCYMRLKCEEEFVKKIVLINLFHACPAA
jgi:hypothetical protein